MRKVSIKLCSIIALLVSYAPISSANRLGDVAGVIRDIAGGPDYYRRPPGPPPGHPPHPGHPPGHGGPGYPPPHGPGPGHPPPPPPPPPPRPPRPEPRPEPGPVYPPRPGDNCQAFDRGHEEHYRGHDSCRSCLRYHGDCVERCESSQVICYASGSDFHHEYEIRHPGVGDSEYEARNEALEICHREGLHRCYVTRCEYSRGEVSTRLCSGRY